MKWFALGAAAGLLGAFVVFWVGVRILPELNVAYSERPELRSVTPGMTYEKVADLMGSADGTITAAELASYDRHRSPGWTSPVDYAGIEAAGGKHRFWLSRSSGLLVFNVVAFDEEDRVLDLWSGYATFFGKD